MQPSINHCGLSSFARKEKGKNSFIHKKDIGTVWLEDGWDLMLSLHNVLYRMEKTYQLFRWKKEEREGWLVGLRSGCWLIEYLLVGLLR